MGNGLYSNKIVSIKKKTHIYITAKLKLSKKITEAKCSKNKGGNLVLTVAHPSHPPQPSPPTSAPLPLMIDNATCSQAKTPTEAKRSTKTKKCTGMNICRFFVAK